MMGGEGVILRFMSVSNPDARSGYVSNCLLSGTNTSKCLGKKAICYTVKRRHFSQQPYPQQEKQCR